MQNLADADKADEDAAARQAEYVAAQAALDSAEEEYSTMQRQLNANRAGLLAKDLQKGKPCPVCGSTKHPKIAALPKDHITEKQLEEREKALTAQRRSTAAASRTAGDAAAHAHELRAALQRDADGFFARRGDRYTGKPAAELTPDELKSIPQGSFIVMKTGTHPLRTRLQLFLNWGITFGEPYVVPERANRAVAYANRVDLARNLPQLSEPEEMDESRGYAVSSRDGIAHAPAQERAVKRGKQMKTFGEEER